MDDFDKIDFAVDFNDLPGTEEELKKGLSAEEQKILSTNTDLEVLMSENNPTKLIAEIFGKKDTPSLTLTHHELVEAVFHAPFFINVLTPEHKKLVGQFLETIAPANQKFFTRDELIVLAKNLILVITNSQPNTYLLNIQTDSFLFQYQDKSERRSRIGIGFTKFKCTLQAVFGRMLSTVLYLFKVARFSIILFFLQPQQRLVVGCLLKLMDEPKLARNCTGSMLRSLIEVADLLNLVRGGFVAAWNEYLVTLNTLSSKTSFFCLCFVDDLLPRLAVVCGVVSSDLLFTLIFFSDFFEGVFWSSGDCEQIVILYFKETLFPVRALTQLISLPLLAVIAGLINDFAFPPEPSFDWDSDNSILSFSFTKILCVSSFGCELFNGSILQKFIAEVNLKEGEAQPVNQECTNKAC
eukprot:TRINITY_DN136155_c0_g1_i1.p1 TRINITY_DN136155_c0_g1~~TRINITY_DN136155_c0_g1_i1.p1  ORF type:complete len:410 (-),score=16.36 TRINITY_DN136155_c0_g1_i1:191-1420(-)